MAPIIKEKQKKVRKATLNVVPPIFMLRKKDSFDKLFDSSSKSNIFDSSTDKDNSRSPKLNVPSPFQGSPRRGGSTLSGYEKPYKLSTPIHSKKTVTGTSSRLGTASNLKKKLLTATPLYGSPHYFKGRKYGFSSNVKTNALHDTFTDLSTEFFESGYGLQLKKKKKKLNQNGRKRRKPKTNKLLKGYDIILDKFSNPNSDHKLPLTSTPLLSVNTRRKDFDNCSPISVSRLEPKIYSKSNLANKFDQQGSNPNDSYEAVVQLKVTSMESIKSKSCEGMENSLQNPFIGSEKKLPTKVDFGTSNTSQEVTTRDDETFNDFHSIDEESKTNEILNKMMKDNIECLKKATVDSSVENIGESELSASEDGDSSACSNISSPLTKGPTDDRLSEQSNEGNSPTQNHSTTENVTCAMLNSLNLSISPKIHPVLNVRKTFSIRNEILSVPFEEEETDCSPEQSPTRQSHSRSIRNLPLGYNIYDQSSLEPLPENQEYPEDSTSKKIDKSLFAKDKSPVEDEESHFVNKNRLRRYTKRINNERSPTRRDGLSRPSVFPELNKVIEEPDNDSCLSEQGDDILPLEHFVLPAGKKYRRSLCIIKHLENEVPFTAPKGRNYESSVEQIIKLQTANVDSDFPMPTNILKKRISIRRTSLMKQFTPPPRRRNRMMSMQFPSPGSSMHKNVRLSFMKSSFDLKMFPLTQSPTAAVPQRIGLDSLKEKTPADWPFSSETPVLQEGENYKDCVLLLCNQSSPCEFLDILNEDSCSDSIKVGEGVYGEVFMVTRKEKKNVLKIIPIEGSFLVNGEKQKLYSEIYSELLVTTMLNELKNELNDFMTVGFVELVDCSVVIGRYPEHLVKLWEQFDVIKGSDNDNPKIFEDDQLFLVLELGNAGTDLESYSFSTAKQALSIFKQMAFSLAVAEAAFEFEHRDLHWGNVLIGRTAEKELEYRLENEKYKVVTNGVKATIIDYTLSRVTYKEQIPIFCDIGKDPDMFIATGDYQFDIYRHMRKDLNNQWSEFEPKTNVRWLHYILDKMIKKVKYQRPTAKVHKDSMKCLNDIESWILDCDTSIAVAVQVADKRLTS